MGLEPRVREQRLPGIGHRYELVLAGGHRLVIVLQEAGGRELGIIPAGAEDATTVVGLSQDQAVAVAALLSGARFSIERAETGTLPPDPTSEEVAVETVVLEPGSPAVGRVAREVPMLDGADAAVLAVIRDETPELLEDSASAPCRPGDRVVVAARRDRLADVVRQFTG